MGIIISLIVISLVIALVFLTAFLWAVKDGQYDDDYTPSVRMLFEDELVSEPSSSEENTTDNQSLNNNVNQ